MASPRDLFAAYLRSNRLARDSLPECAAEAGAALIDAQQSELFFLHGVLKTGVIFSSIHGLTALALPPLRVGRKQRRVIDSWCRKSVRSKSTFLITLLRDWRLITQAWRKARRKPELVNLKIDGIHIGPYIWDACYAARSERLSFRQRLKILYLIVCHRADCAVVSAYRVKLMIVGDPAYRTGMLYELCRARSIPCINAVNVEILQMHKYYLPSEFGLHFRDVPQSLVARLATSRTAVSKIDAYFSARFNGRIQQHDVVRAFGRDKIRRTRADLIAEHDLDGDLPLVFVMAHVLSDAPHNYSPLLHLDFEDWLGRTVTALASNARINFVVKEHPSVDLYGEAGILRRILVRLGCGDRLVQSDLHTKSVLEHADVVLTCGGTIGIEAASLGIPVILAGRPPYAGKGFTIEPKNAEEYGRLLASGIESVQRLTEAQIGCAKRVAYVLFDLFDNEALSLELGGVTYVRGKEFPINDFFRNVIVENEVPLMRQRVYQRLREFHESSDTSIINYRKLRDLLEIASPGATSAAS